VCDGTENPHFIDKQTQAERDWSHLPRIPQPSAAWASTWATPIQGLTALQPQSFSKDIRSIVLTYWAYSAISLLKRLTDAQGLTHILTSLLYPQPPSNQPIPQQPMLLQISFQPQSLLAKISTALHKGQFKCPLLSAVIPNLPGAEYPSCVAHTLTYPGTFIYLLPHSLFHLPPD
jgi:hypothetical protein